VSTYLSSARARALRPVGSLPRPRLTIVSTTASRAPKIPFVVLVVALLALGLVGLLVLNTSMERGAYTAGALRAQSAALAQRQQQLQIEVADLGDPQRVSHRAQRLGMVQNPTPAFIELGSGRVLGRPTRAVAGDTPDVSMTPPDAVKLGRKIFAVLAGANSTATIGEVVVPGVKGAHGKTNAGDTHGGSADRGAAGGTTVPGAATRQ
jgi:cell division protein FtsL